MSDQLAKRLGALFILALQNDDAELREAATVAKEELDFSDGPSFVPVATLTRLLKEAKAALDNAGDAAALLLDYAKEQSPNVKTPVLEARILRARAVAAEIEKELKS